MSHPLYFPRYILKLCLWIGLAFSAFAPAAEPRDLDLAIDQLLAGDTQVIPDLVKVQDQALPRLISKRFPEPINLQPLLEQLGADFYEDRIAAVQSLSKMGLKIGPEVTAFQQQHLDDPEILKRTQQVLDHLEDLEQQVDHLAVVTFLLTCQELQPEVFLPLQESYQKVFAEKPKELFAAWKQPEPPELFLDFATQVMQIPDLQPSFVLWLLRKGDKQSIQAILRHLLKLDFETTFLAFNVESNHSHEVDNLILNEFADQLTMQRIHLRIKRIYNRQREAPSFTFDPTQPLSPELAFQLFNLTQRSTLASYYSTYLLEKMAPLSVEAVRTLILTTPLENDFIPILVEKWPELQPELQEIVLQKLTDADQYGLWLSAYSIATRELDMSFEIGELDSQWIQLYEKEGKHNQEHMLRNGAHFKITPHLLISHLQQQGPFTGGLGMGNDTFAYLLEVDDPEIQREALRCMSQLNGKTTVRSNDVAEIWSIVLKNPNGASEKIDFLGRIQHKNFRPFLRQQMTRKLSPELSPRLKNFYEQNRELILPLLQTELLSPTGFTLMCLLSEIPELPEADREILEAALINVLRQNVLPPDNMFCALLTGLNLKTTDPLWFHALLNQIENPRFRFSSFPIWQLEYSLSPFLPDLQTKLTPTTEHTTKLLCTGLMIDPELPEWSAHVQTVLQQNDDPKTVAMLISTLSTLNQEPDLSQLSQERQAFLFDASTLNKDRAVKTLLKTLKRPENKQTALKNLQPQLNVILNYNRTHTDIGTLFIEEPDSWDLVGETCLSLVETGNLEQAQNAASQLTFFDAVPMTVFPRILQVLENPDSDLRTRNSLLWVVAGMGQQASEYAERIRNLTISDKEGLERYAFALATISPKLEERKENLDKLIESTLADPSTLRMRMIRRVEGFELEKLAFFNQVLAQAYVQEMNPRQVYPLKEIIYAATSFQHQETAWPLYQDLLIHLADPELENLSLQLLADTVMETLISEYPNQIPNFIPLVDDLPPTTKQTKTYRAFIEKAKITDH
ncbi:hypothetical protein P3T73_01630 [Kiritimatiellota bacterium B12222]|nr:hypothetical protein P3T73_01630 [Kiritimatiellota bacterium B12222]